MVAYLGDTSWTDVLFALSELTDGFICECNFFDFKVKGPMNYLKLERRLPEFSCKRILLTHFDQQMADRLDVVTLECLHDGMELVL